MAIYGVPRVGRTKAGKSVILPPKFKSQPVLKIADMKQVINKKSIADGFVTYSLTRTHNGLKFGMNKKFTIQELENAATRSIIADTLRAARLELRNAIANHDSSNYSIVPATVNK